MTTVSHSVFLVLLLASQSPCADTAWARLYDGVTGSCLNRAADIAIGPQGLLYVAGGGEVTWPRNSDMHIAAYRRDGNFLGARCHGGLGSPANDMSYGVVADSEGYAYAAGFTFNEPVTRGDDISWMKVRYEGDSMARPWANKSSWPGDDRAFDIIFGKSNDLYMCGADHRDTMLPELSSFMVMRIDPQNSESIWSRSLMMDKDARPRSRQDPFPGLFSEWSDWDNCATCLAITEQGKVVVGGFGMSGRTGRDVWVMEFDTSGNRLWSTVYSSGNTYDDVVFDMAVARDGSIYLCGLTESEESFYDILVLRLADTGGVMNVHTYNGMLEGDDYATQLVLDDEELQNVYVTGVSEHALRSYQVMSQKLDHYLVPCWGDDGAQFGWAGDDFGYDIAYCQHRAYVAGTVSDNVRLICYSDSNVVGGETLWTYSYDLPDHLRDYGSCLCVLDSNEIYLGGECDRLDSAGNWSSMFLARLRTSRPGVEERQPIGKSSAFLIPNPVSRSEPLMLRDLPPSITKLELYDAAGRRIGRLSMERRGSSVVLAISRAKAGIVFLRATGSDGQVVGTTKLVLQ